MHFIQLGRTHRIFSKSNFAAELKFQFPLAMQSYTIAITKVTKKLDFVCHILLPRNWRLASAWVAGKTLLLRHTQVLVMSI